MNKKEALNIISQVTSVYKGTLQDHTLIQEALKYLEGLEENKIIVQ